MHYISRCFPSLFSPKNGAKNYNYSFYPGSLNAKARKVFIIGCCVSIGV
jgi:hypothetical protein